MAGDWLPMRLDLDDDPAVIQIAAATGLDEFGVVGRLLKLWGWANRNTADGNAEGNARGVTESWVDRYTNTPGFAAAMVAAGWLAPAAGGGAGVMCFPNFDRWNTKGAKQRALTARRVAAHRVAGNAPGNAPRNAAGVTGALTTEQNRTGQDKEDKTPPPPAGVGPRPEEVREAWNAQPGLTPCVEVGPHRERAIRAWATGNPLWAAHWRAAIAFAGRTPDYTGGMSSGWRADLNWFLKPENFTKVVEQMLAPPVARAGGVEADPAVRAFRAQVEADRKRAGKPGEAA